MNEYMNRKLRHKLDILNGYLQRNLDTVIERKEKWEERIEEEGNRPLTYMEDASLTYADMLKIDLGNIEYYSKQIEENNQLIEELEGM